MREPNKQHLVCYPSPPLITGYSAQYLMNDLMNLSGYLLHYPALGIVMTTAIILLIGLIGQILAEKTALPGVIFLLIFGLFLGKYGLGIINPNVFGSAGIRAITAICVAIIVFEGGLLINLHHLKSHLFSVLSLISANVFITVWALSALTTWLLEVDFKIALLYSALVSVTGPTVIMPILKRIHVSPKVRSILETEAVLVDAVGVITVVSIFHYITSKTNSDMIAIFNNIFSSLVLGTLSGISCALLTRYIVNRFAPLSSEVTRLTVLACALLAYVVGEILSHESGIAAAAVAGITIGNVSFPYKESIKEFKGDLTFISVTIVFLLLAVDLDFQVLFQMGWRGLLCVLILMAVIRPCGVFLSTLFEKITWREKLFIASLGPRGIVAASAGAFFAVELKSFGFEGSEFIKGMVFLTVFVTIVIQGGSARFMAHVLNISPSSILIVGGGLIGEQLALSMKLQGESVIIIENAEDKAERLSKAGIYVVKADAVDDKTYRNLIPVDKIKTLITTSEDDWLNLRVCQILKQLKPNLKAISIINDIKGRAVFENIDIATINLKEAAVKVISDSVRVDFAKNPEPGLAST